MISKFFIQLERSYWIWGVFITSRPSSRPSVKCMPTYIQRYMCPYIVIRNEFTTPSQTSPPPAFCSFYSVQVGNKTTAVGPGQETQNVELKLKMGKQKELALFSVVPSTTADYIIKRFIEVYRLVQIWETRCLRCLRITMGQPNSDEGPGFSLWSCIYTAQSCWPPASLTLSRGFPAKLHGRIKFLPI